MIHLQAISASYSSMYGLQSISLILLTNRTSNTTLLVVGTILGVTYGICITGGVCVIELAMPSITTLIIWARNPKFV